MTSLNIPPLGLEEESALKVSDEVINWLLPLDRSERIKKAIGLLLNAEPGDPFLTPFKVGNITLYGQPVVMAAKSGLIANLIDNMKKEGTASFHLAADTKLKDPPLALLSVWLVINGIIDEYSILPGPKFKNEDVIRIRLETWDWIKYFDVSTKSFIFNRFVLQIFNPMTHIILNTYPGFEAVKIDEKKFEFPKEFLPYVEDLDEQLKSMALEKAFFPDRHSDYNIKRWFDFLLKRVTHKQFLELPDKVPSAGKAAYFGYPVIR